MEIRRIEDRTDVRELLRVNVLAWRAAYDGLVPEDVLAAMDPEPDEERVDGAYEGLQADREGVFVADDDGVVGYAYARWAPAMETKSFVGEAEAGLKELYVHPDRWGEGVGTALLSRVEDALPDRIERLKLETISGNDVGESFYRSRGFEAVGEDTFDLESTSVPTTVYELSL